LATADRHCVPTSVGARSSEFARLELGTFYFAIFSKTFCGFIKEDEQKKGAKTRKKNHRIYDPTGRNLPSGDKDIAPFNYWRLLEIGGRTQKDSLESNRTQIRPDG